MMAESKAIRQLRDADGKELPAYAWPGGYPMYYLDSGMAVLCPACANKWGEYSTDLDAYDINWEDPDLYCENCNGRIESAYAEED
ncbi:MAG: hypothetical protein IT318_20220 [Anaerolineales bacterium]|nr:hypothetical protein [Anaerolineales bacterium]